MSNRLSVPPPGTHHDRWRPAMRVLVVEDFEVLARSIGTGLRQEGMAVDVVLNGTDALDRLAFTRYDVVVLDRDLPGVHGDDICRQLAHRRSETRVLMLTAADTIEDRVDGLSLGADDYLPKPFAFAELVARVRALARRATPPVPPTSPTGTSHSTRPAGWPPGPVSASISAPRSSPSSNACSPHPAWSSPPRNSSNESGTRPPTPSPPRSKRPCTDCGPSSATRP